MSAGIEPRDLTLPGTPTLSMETREPVLEIKDLSIAYRTGAADVRAVRWLAGTATVTPGASCIACERVMAGWRGAGPVSRE